MDFDKKFALAMKELRTKKVGRYHDADMGPWFARLIGVKLRPAHYRSFLFNSVFYSSIFLFFLALPLVVFHWSELDMAYAKNVVLPAVLSSLGGGLCIAFYCKMSANHHSLTSWEEL